MAALTGPKRINESAVGPLTVPVKGATTIFEGALVCLDASGFAINGTVATGLVAIGVADQTVVNPGADGDKSITVRCSAGDTDFVFANEASSVTAAHVGRTVYVQDSQTVHGVATGRSAAGTCTRVGALGVYVRMAV